MHPRSPEREKARYTEPSSSSLLVSPKDIIPVPSTSSKTVGSVKRKGSATLITSTPYKKYLEESNMKKKKVGTKKTKNKKPVIEKKLTIKKKKIESSSSESDGSEELQYDDTSEEDNDDAECLFCSGKYSEDVNGEKWAQCNQCFRWCHEDCGEVHEAKFTCPLCEKGTKGKRKILFD